MGYWLMLGARSPPPAHGPELARLGVMWNLLGNSGTGPCRPGPLSGSPSQDQLAAHVLGVCFLWVLCAHRGPLIHTSLFSDMAILVWQKNLLKSERGELRNIKEELQGQEGKRVRGQGVRPCATVHLCNAPRTTLQGRLLRWVNRGRPRSQGSPESRKTVSCPRNKVLHPAPSLASSLLTMPPAPRFLPQNLPPKD